MTYPFSAWKTSSLTTSTTPRTLWQSRRCLRICEPPYSRSKVILHSGLIAPVSTAGFNSFRVQVPYIPRAALGKDGLFKTRRLKTSLNRFGASAKSIGPRLISFIHHGAQRMRDLQLGDLYLVRDTRISPQTLSRHPLSYSPALLTLLGFKMRRQLVENV
jgi:hypothetical protein